jgi:hypothetical protein
MRVIDPRLPKPTKSLYAVIAAVVLSVIVAPVAIAGAASGPQATSSAGVSKAVKNLKRQVSALQRQVKGLQGQGGGPTQSAPIGPAGGDLTGAFPNPLIGPNAVASAELQDNSVGSTEILTDAAGSAEIASNAVGSAEIQNGAVTGLKIASESIGVNQLVDNGVHGTKIQNDTVSSVDIASAAIGSSELKALTAAVGADTTITAAGGPGEAAVTCPNGRTLIAGGYAWLDDEANSIIASAPSETDPTHTWVVRGMVAAGSNRLFAWATCLL